MIILRKNIQFIYILSRSPHWFILGPFFPIMVLIQPETGLDLMEVIDAEEHSTRDIILRMQKKDIWQSSPACQD